MTPCLVVLTNFFAVSNRALSFAAALAVPLGAHLLLLHAPHDELLAPPEFGAYHRRGTLKTRLAFEELAAAQPVPTEVDIANDSLAGALHEAIEHRNPLLVVLGQPGFESAPAGLVPHTAQRLLRQVRCPLLVLPAVGWGEFPPRCLLLALDGQPFDLGVLPSLLPRLLRATGATVEAVHITDAATLATGLSTVETKLALQLVLTQSSLLEDPLAVDHLHEAYSADAATGILEEATRLQADLLVVIARPHSFLGRLFHESVTARLLAESPLPVLLLPALS